MLGHSLLYTIVLTLTISEDTRGITRQRRGVPCLAHGKQWPGIGTEC